MPSRPPAPGLAARRFDAAMIDLDGTLVDTLPDFADAIGFMLAELGLAPADLALIRRSIGKGADHLVGSVLEGSMPGQRPDAELIERGRQSYRRHYSRLNGRRAIVFPGVVEGLAAMRAQGLRLACLTNKPTAFAEALLATTRLSSHFELVFGGDRFARLKPDPLPLLETCRALGTEPERTLMVGDSSNDARAARAAGCPVVLMTYGYNHGEPVQGVDADGCFDSLLEVAESLSAAPRNA